MSDFLKIPVRVSKKEEKTLKREIVFGYEDDLDSYNPRDWSCDDTLLIGIEDNFNSLGCAFHKSDKHYHEEAVALKKAKSSDYKFFQLLKYRDYGSGGVDLTIESEILPIDKLEKAFKDADFNLIMLGNDLSDIEHDVEDLQAWVSGEIYTVWAFESRKCESCGEWKHETIDGIGGLKRQGHYEDFNRDLWMASNDAFNVADQWEPIFKDAKEIH